MTELLKRVGREEYTPGILDATPERGNELGISGTCRVTSGEYGIMEP
jgi:hypothetical protein